MISLIYLNKNHKVEVGNFYVKSGSTLKKRDLAILIKSIEILIIEASTQTEKQ
jgi:hypothetical protein